MSKGVILYIGGFELPDRNAAAHRVLSNGKILREIGYDVVYIDIDKNMEYNEQILNTKRNIQDFDCWSEPYPKTKKQWIHYLTSINTFLKISDKYANIKAVICYNYQAIAFMKIKKYCRRNNIKVIADCTEWYSTKGSNIVFKIIKGLDSFIRMRIIQKNLDGLIVISDYLEKFYSKSKNVICIPPLVDLLEKKWNIPISKNDNDEINVVYAGSPGKYKDKLNIIIDELYKLQDKCKLKFYIIGITKEQYLNYYKNHDIKIKKLDGIIYFLGHKTHAESLKYIKEADFTMFIRDNNRVSNAGFPTKFVESITCGTPVITTNSSDLSNYIEDGKNGFFIHINDKLTSELEVIFKFAKVNNIKTQEISKNTFSYENYVNRMNTFLKEIVN